MNYFLGTLEYLSGPIIFLNVPILTCKWTYNPLVSQKACTLPPAPIWLLTTLNWRVPKIPKSKGTSNVIMN